MNLKGVGTALLMIVMLAACKTTPEPVENLFAKDNAWLGEAPTDADMVSPEDFRKGIDSGELVLSSSAIITAQAAAREQQYQDDKAFLQSLPDKPPYIQALLAEAAKQPDFEGDRPVTLPDGQTVVLFGLSTELRNAVEAYKLSQSVDNALADYTLSYSLLPDRLKAQLPTPESLKGKPLAEVKAALDKLNDLLGTETASLGTARLETNGPQGDGIQPQVTPSPGNGTDNNGPCAPKNYFAHYWFPLKNFISPVKNQGSRGTCWAFAAVGAVESRERVQNNNPANLSEQFLVNRVKHDWNPSDFVDGYWPELALTTAVGNNQSFPSETFWTYNRASLKAGDNSYANTCNGYTGTCSNTAHESRRICTTFIGFTFCSYERVTFGGPGVASGNTIQVWQNGSKFDLDRYRQLLAQGHVIMASFPVYKGFYDVGGDGILSNYAQTFINDKGKEVSGSYGGHALQIVGFLSNFTLNGDLFNDAHGGGYFIIKNSWGCGAGDGGYYYVPADYVSRLFGTLSVLDFDARRSDAWTSEQTTPGGTEAPKITVEANPAHVDLRVETHLAQFFTVSHPVAKKVNLSVTSDKDGNLYNGPWDIINTGLGQLRLPYTFTSQGQRTLTLVAKYGSKQAQATLKVDVVNTPPTLTLQAFGDPRQGEAFSITALIKDINEADTTKLCANTVWSADRPDVRSASSGCQVTVTFGATGSRQVRVSTQDSEEATAQQTLTLNVLPPPQNPYPRIVSSGVYSKEFFKAGPGFLCGLKTVAGGSTIDLRNKGCNATATPPDPPRYSAQVEVENPTGETLTYDWALYSSGPGTYKGTLATKKDSADPSFPFAPLYNNTDLVTDSCWVTLKVNAPDPSRSKSLTVWAGRCTYYSDSLK